MSNYAWWWRYLPPSDPRREAPLNAYLEEQMFVDFPWMENPRELYIDWDEYFAVSEQIWALREGLA